MGARYVTLHGIAKENQHAGASVVATEYISGRLAALVGLPCPPCGVAVAEDGSPAFFSMRFGSLSVRPAPLVPSDMFAEWEQLAYGVILFDLWILNHDRHPENIAYQGEGRSPIIFDHSHAFNGGHEVEALRVLPEHQDDLLLGHCLLSGVQSGAGFAPWIDRIRVMRDWMIEPLIDDACEVGGLPQDCRTHLIDFLAYRRANLGDLLRSQLPAVGDWPFDVGKGE